MDDDPISGPDVCVSDPKTGRRSPLCTGSPRVHRKIDVVLLRFEPPQVTGVYCLLLSTVVTVGPGVSPLIFSIPRHTTYFFHRPYLDGLHVVIVFIHLSVLKVHKRNYLYSGLQHWFRGDVVRGCVHSVVPLQFFAVDLFLSWYRMRVQEPSQTRIIT